MTLPYSIFSTVYPELAELPNCLFVRSLSVMLAGGGYFILFFVGEESGGRIAGHDFRLTTG